MSPSQAAPTSRSTSGLFPAMLSRVLAAFLMIGVAIVLIELTPSFLFLIVASVLVAGCFWEMSRLLKACGLKIYAVAGLAAALFPWLWTLAPQWRAEGMAAALLIILAWSLADPGDVSMTFSSASANAVTAIYLGLPFALLSDSQRRGENYEVWLVLIAVWASDIAALLIGKAIGKRRITPRLSPNKSLEGYLAALAAAALTGLGFALFYPEGRSQVLLVAEGLAIGFFGILGDLIESAVKRGAKIKDSSGLIPGHGGLMDRFDSMLFAIPAFYLLHRLVE